MHKHVRKLFMQHSQVFTYPSAHMTPTPTCIDDSYATYIRKCIVFPAEGSEPRVLDMTIRTLTQEGLANIQVSINRTVDLADQYYASEYCKMHVMGLGRLEPGHSQYLLSYNMSSKLPLNRCVARIIGINLDKAGSNLFWRGDVVVMRFEPRGAKDEEFSYIDCEDADLSVVSRLEERLRDFYNVGSLERNSTWDEMGLSDRNPISIDSIAGRLSRLEMGFTTMQQALPTIFSSITGPPVFPPEIEREIFETCARNNRSTCLKLVLVARRVREWVEPILFETLVLDQDWSTYCYSSQFEWFMANIDYKPQEFYSKHVKNLWISAPDDPDAFERILTFCGSVENLVLFPRKWRINPPFIPFLEIPNAGGCLNRLTCKLDVLFPPWSTSINFRYPCFANLTHLHLYDDDDEWPTYTGFEHLRSLTHLALACCGPQQLAAIMPRLPALKYVALCHYESTEYGRLTVNCKIPVEVYGNKVVWLQGLKKADWENGAAGQGDFWDMVEEEVAMRRTVGRVQV